MKRILRCRPSPGTILGLAGLTVALGGVAFAAIPDSSGTIHACYQTSNGSLRVVESSSDCRKSEASLDWNQQGASGSAGYPPGNANSTRPDPPASPTGTVVETRVSLSQAGRLLVSGSLDSESIHCASGPACPEQFGLYVDGVPVPGTGTRPGQFSSPGGSDTGYENFQQTFLGKSSVLLPGEHVATLSRTLFSGSATFETIASINAIAIEP
jgi:hypothetical protein